MLHAREDYASIQEITTNGTTRRIPADEPVFLIRGQDIIGGAIVRAWAGLAEVNDADAEIVRIAREHADKMDAWPKKKVADLPADAKLAALSRSPAVAQGVPAGVVRAAQDLIAKLRDAPTTQHGNSTCRVVSCFTWAELIDAADALDAALAPDAQAGVVGPDLLPGLREALRRLRHPNAGMEPPDGGSPSETDRVRNVAEEIEELIASLAASGAAPAGGLPGVFSTLREANVARQAAWCPDQVPDLSFRGNELGGEVGEALNVIKKLERERHGWRGSRDTVEHLAEELADVVICADLVAITAGIDLDAAVVAKFNATSEKVGLPHRLATAGTGDAARPPVSAGGAMAEGWRMMPVDPTPEVIQAMCNATWGPTSMTPEETHRKGYAAAIIAYQATTPAPHSLADPNSWEAEVEPMLRACPETVRCCEGGGPEDLKGSLVLTFMRMQAKLKAATPAPQSPAGGLREVEAILDPIIDKLVSCATRNGYYRHPTDPEAKGYIDEGVGPARSKLKAVFSAQADAIATLLREHDADRGVEQSQAARDVLAERRRQVEVEVEVEVEGKSS